MYWGAYNEPLVYSIDDPSHPIYEIIAKSIDLLPFFPEKHANDFASLLNDGVIVSESWDRQSAIDEYLKAIHNPKHLHLILLPAGTACNCSCLYCGQDHNGKGMSWEFEGDAIVKLDVQVFLPLELRQIAYYSALQESLAGDQPHVEATDFIVA